jgi:hypothetical protein
LIFCCVERLGSSLCFVLVVEDAVAFISGTPFLKGDTEVTVDTVRLFEIIVHLGEF